METSRSIPRREWLIAAGLILLALVPMLAGAIRVGEIVSGAPETSTNARFLRVPAPIVLHIVSALGYSIIGAIQLLPGLRRRHLAWHRFAGRYLLVPMGLVVAVSGLWMTAYYDMPAVDGVVLALSRYLVGGLMLVFLVAGVAAIIRRDVFAHGAWMIRAYALAMGAGTQVFTSGPFLLIFGEPDVVLRAVQMDAGWIINAVVAEWVIARRRAARRRGRPALIAA